MGFHDSTGRYVRTTQGQVRVPFTAWLAAGTALAAFADGASPTPGYAVDNSEAVGIRWNNHATPAAIFAAIPLPYDMKPNTDVYVRVLSHKTGATLADAVTYTIAAFVQKPGALHDADANLGGATNAMTGDATSKMTQLCSRTLPAAEVTASTPAAPTMLSLSIKPTDGTLGTDDVTMTGLWLEYTKASNES